ncbi:hypothetical protein [Haliscomenobacter hydrossis]|uniref:Uncharacterized protein n=1 Tax=Haliscomenobacter hydrossis (strain ATCC 27775 / DSM 1100 / LMG 10767 / O) TaxID=760192 RepID=F4KW88_HALH1|nr:hypothetical protein [Haliscomenobacter hydrossis]AEE49276.1 hypothetical protein Halhy_1381 [Haliscomenobacter hydrossis DSM 1100]
MTTQLVLRFDNADDLIRVLLFLKEQGMEDLAFGSNQPRLKRKKDAEKKTWEGVGSINLQDKLNTIPNLRDFAYED